MSGHSDISRYPREVHKGRAYRVARPCVHLAHTTHPVKFHLRYERRPFRKKATKAIGITKCGRGELENIAALRHDRTCYVESRRQRR